MSISLYISGSFYYLFGDNMDNSASYIGRVRVFEYMGEVRGYSVGIPIKIARRLGLRKGDKVLVVISKKLDWYHLIDWYNNPKARELWQFVPREGKIFLCESNAAPVTLCRDMGFSH